MSAKVRLYGWVIQYIYQSWVGMVGGIDAQFPLLVSSNNHVHASVNGHLDN